MSELNILTIIGLIIILLFLLLIIVLWFIILIIHFQSIKESKRVKKIKVKTLVLYNGLDKVSEYAYSFVRYVRLKRIVKKRKYSDIRLAVNTNIVYYSKGANNGRN